jgi:MFS family permease
MGCVDPVQKARPDHPMPPLSSAAFVAWQRTTAGLPRTFWLLWLGTFINRIGIFVMPYLTLFLTRERGYTVEQAAQVLSAIGAGAFLSQFIGGWVSDRVGRKPGLLLSFAFTPIALMALYAASTPAALLLAGFALGVVTDIYRPASSALIADVVPAERRPHAYTLRYWAINLGASFGLFLGGVFARIDYAILFIGDALTTLAFGLIVLCWIREPPRPAARRSAEALPPETEAAEGSAPATRAYLLRACAFLALLVFVFMLQGGVYLQSESLLSLAMTTQGLTEADYGAAIAVNGITIVLLSLPLAARMRRYSLFVSLCGGLLLLGIGVGLQAAAQTTLAYAACIAIWTLGEILTAPLGPSIAAEIAPRRHVGLFQGMVGSSYGLAAFVAPLLGSAVYQRDGAAALWLGCAAVCTVTALLVWWVARPAYARLGRFSAAGEASSPLRADSRLHPKSG